MGLRAESVLRRVERLQLIASPRPIDKSVAKNLAHFVSVPQTHMGDIERADLPPSGSQLTLNIAGLLTASTDLGFEWERAVRMSGINAALCFIAPDPAAEGCETVAKTLYISSVEALLLACWSDINLARTGDRPREAESLTLVQPLLACLCPRQQEASMCARLVLNLLGQRLLSTARPPRLQAYFVQQPVTEVRPDRIERMRDTDLHY
eukprot:5492900-Amphidinium_carterae.1